MDNILDQEEGKIKKQTFAKLTLLFALLTIFSIVAMMFFIHESKGLNNGMPKMVVLFAIAYVFFGFLSFVFSFITIYLKEPWTLIKIGGIVLSGLIFILFVAGLGVSLYATI